jgi:ABC-2 type transport system permease protein
MTTTSVPSTRESPEPVARRGATFVNLMRAEWTKIRSVRSTVWTLIVFVIVTAGLTALINWLTETHWNGPRAAAVPRRIPALAAKAVVFAALLIVVAEIVSFGSFFVGSAILHAHVPVSLSGPGVTRAVIGAGLYLTVLGLFALAIGTIIRHTAGAIATAIGAVFVLPILSGLLPGSWGAHINAYLPEQAGSLITHTQQQASDLLSPWQGFGVLCIWTVLLLALAAYLLDRRDA